MKPANDVSTTVKSSYSNLFIRVAIEEKCQPCQARSQLLSTLSKERKASCCKLGLNDYCNPSLEHQ